MIHQVIIIMLHYTAKKYIKEKYNITVNFSVSSDMYAGAYRYATKYDKEKAFMGNVIKVIQIWK